MCVNVEHLGRFYFIVPLQSYVTIRFRHTTVSCDQFHCFRGQSILKYNKSMFLKVTLSSVIFEMLYNIVLKEVEKVTRNTTHCTWKKMKYLKI